MSEPSASQFLGAFSKRLDEHASSIGLWGLETLVQDEIVWSGKADDHQKREYNARVTERRAIMLLNDLGKQVLAELIRSAPPEHSAEGTSNI